MDYGEPAVESANLVPIQAMLSGGEAPHGTNPLPVGLYWVLRQNPITH